MTPTLQTVNICWMASWFQMKYLRLQSTFHTQFSVKSQNAVIFTWNGRNIFERGVIRDEFLVNIFSKQCSSDSNLEYYRFLCNVNLFSSTNCFIQSAESYMIFIIFAGSRRSKIAVFSSFFEFLPSIYQPKHLLLFFYPLQYVNMTVNFSQI